MRTPNSGTSRGLRLGAGIALAGSALAIAPLAPAFAQPGTPLPADAPAQDLSITLASDAKSYPVGNTLLWGFVPKSNVKTSYSVKIELPDGLEVVGTPSRIGFECGVSANKRTVTCGNHTSEVEGYQPFTMDVKATKTGTFTAKATIDGDAPDANPADNTATETVTITDRTSASVKGVVWDDANANGVRDKGEKGIAGLKVLLFIRTAPTPIVKAITGKGGAYAFNLDMSNSGGNWYTVLVGSSSKDLKPTTPDRGNDDARDSDLYAETGTAAQRKHFNGLPTSGSAVELSAGVHTVLDGGFTRKVPAGTIRGRIWNDLDADGVMDAGEPGVSGVTIALADATNPAHSRVHVAKTDGNGRYHFDNLPIPTNGDPYALFVASPKGWKWAPNQHSNAMNPSEVDADIRAALGTNQNVQWVFAGPVQDDTNSMVAGLTKVSGDDTLPTTGASVQGVAGGGGALLLGGLGLAFAARRRRTA